MEVSKIANGIKLKVEELNSLIKDAESEGLTIRLQNNRAYISASKQEESLSVEVLRVIEL